MRIDLKKKLFAIGTIFFGITLFNAPICELSCSISHSTLHQNSISFHTNTKKHHFHQVNHHSQNHFLCEVLHKETSHYIFHSILLFTEYNYTHIFFPVYQKSSKLIPFAYSLIHKIPAFILYCVQRN